MLEHSKKRKIVRSVFKQLLFVWLAFFLMTFISYFFVKSIVNDYLAKEAKNALSYTESKVVTELLQAETSLQNIAQSVRAIILRGNSANIILEYLTKMSEYLVSSGTRVAGFSGVYGVFDVFGDMYLDGTDWIPPEGYMPKERPWYKAAIAADSAVAATAPYVDAQTGEVVVSYSERILDNNGKQLGVVSMDLSLDRIVKYVIDTRLTEGGYGILLNENLEIIATPTKENMGKLFSELPYKGISDIVNDLKKGIDVSEYKMIIDDRKNKEFIMFTKRFENGWYMGILTPMDQYYRKVMNIRVFIIALGVFLALILSTMLFYVAMAKHESDEKNKQMKKLINEAVQISERVEAASKAKSDFLAKMSHEIRTPMNAIIGMAELALRENLPNAAREYIITIKQAGANLLSIINDILDISKIESGKLEIVPNDYLFSSIINDVVSIIRMRVVDSDISFVVNIDCNIPNSLFGDETKIRQVLLNLLSNAVKYTKKGFVSFSVVGEITEDTVILTIDVTDSGKGIKPEDLEGLFGEFVQVDMVSNKGIEGTGLGLAITKKLVNAMGGDISVQSEYGKGSIFTITLPQKINSPEPLASVEKPEEKSVIIYECNEIYVDSMMCSVDNLRVECERAENDDDLREKLQAKDYTFLFVSYYLLKNANAVIEELKSKPQIVVLTEFGNAIADMNLRVLDIPVYSISVANILNGTSDNFSYSTNENITARFIAPRARVLIVDDIDTNLKVANGLMLPYKMQVDLCTSGAEAIKRVKADSYDLVFMDHMMPEMDGIEATKHIRETYTNLPIIALTANAVSGVKEMFLSNGFNDFLSKPIDTIKLNSILEKWLPEEKQEKVMENTHKMSSIDESNSNVSFKIDGIDVNKGLAMTGGTIELYMQILNTFYKDGVKKVKEIKECLETDNYPLYTTYVHAIKSASASIGALDLSETAKSLEIAGKQEDFTYIKQHNPQFLTILEVLLNNINTTLLANKKVEQKDSIDFEALKTELNKLKEAIGILDSDAIDEATTSLKAFTQVANIGDSIDNILQKTLIGEYEETVSMINILMEEIKNG